MKGEKEKKSNVLIWAVVGVVALAIIYFMFFRAPPVPKVPPQPGYVLPTEGFIHWHPQLTILIHGNVSKIPAGIGLGGATVTHPEIPHTHDASGKLHYEVTNPRYNPELMTLGAFFRAWGMTFNSTCIASYCNGPDGTVRMTVNGVQTDRFGDWYVSDGDQIVIRYE